MPGHHAPKTPIRELFFAAIDRSVAFVEFSLEGEILDANPYYLALSGYTLDEIVGKNHKALCPAEQTFSPDYAAFWNALRDGQSIADLFLRQRKDGSVFWVEAVYTPMLSSVGDVDRVIALAIDVTNRQEETQGKLARLDTLEKNLLMAEFRHNGEIAAINDACAAMIGCTQNDLANNRFSAFFPPDNPAVEEHIWNILRTGQTYTGTLPFFSSDGSERLCESTFVSDVDDTGKITRIIMLAAEKPHTGMVRADHLEKLRRMAGVAENTGAAVMIADKNHRILYANQGVSRLYGYDRHEVEGKNLRLVYGPSAKTLDASLKRARGSGEPLREDVLTYAKNGRCFWTAVHMDAVTDAHGELQYLVGVHVDITDAKIHEVLLHKALATLALDVPVAKVLSTLCREVEHLVPDTALAIYSVTEAGKVVPVAFPSLPQKFGRIFTTLATASNSTTIKALRSGKTVIKSDLTRNECASEMGKNLLDFGFRSCWSLPVKDAAGKGIGAITFYYREARNPDPFHLRIVNVLQHLCSLAMERSRTTDTMRRISFYDELTGLPNSALFRTQAERLITKAVRLNRPLALFHIGLDKFKRFNDTLGREASDLFLRTIGERLSEKYGSPAIVSRVISDEFLLILYDCNARQAASTANELQAMIRMPSASGDITITTTASIGISLFPGNGATVSELIHNAEMAMHQAKAAGRAQYSFFSEEENSKAKEKLFLESHLREAVAQRQLHLFYQPKIWMNGNGLYGVEALARWKCPPYGSVPPMQFIPLAEETGLIAELGSWTLEEACRQMGAWHAKDIHVPSIAVNLSPSSFRDENLPAFIHRCLKKFNLKPAHLILELTENVLLDNDPQTLRSISRVHKMGVSLSMDDFGTGYSSLSYLRQLPISELKLDKSFVHGIDRDKTSQDLGKAVMHIAESLNLTVVAEGVETHQEYTLLKNLGYHVIQGYFSASPLSAGDFENWNAAHCPTVSS